LNFLWLSKRDESIRMANKPKMLIDIVKFVYLRVFCKMYIIYTYKYSAVVYQNTLIIINKWFRPSLRIWKRSILVQTSQSDVSFFFERRLSKTFKIWDDIILHWTACIVSTRRHLADQIDFIINYYKTLVKPSFFLLSSSCSKKWKKYELD